MRRIISPRWFLLAGLVAGLLAGCTVARSEDAAADLTLPVAVAAAQSGTLLRLQPVSQQLTVGSTTVTQIRIDNASNLAGVELQLRFNPAVLQVQDTNSTQGGVQIQPGDFLNSSGVTNNLVDSGVGLIFYTMTPTASITPASGNGLVASITFRANAPGSSQLTFDLARLTAGDGQTIPVTTQVGQITVAQVGSQPTLTVTSSPTLTPTPTSTATSLPPTATPTLTPMPTPTGTAIPPVTKIPPGATLGFCYTVQAGETLPSLGRKFGMDPRFINRVNDLYPPGHIYVQQALFMPEQYGSGPNIYIFEAGDSLAAIAERCHLPLDFLAEVNQLDPGANLQAGHALIIPLPPFPPPSRYPYPPSVWPPPCCK